MLKLMELQSDWIYAYLPAYRFLRRFFYAYLKKRSIRETLSYVTDDIVSIGTGEHEFAQNKEQLRKLLREEFAAIPQRISLAVKDYEEFEVSKGVYTCSCHARSTLKLNGKKTSFYTRFTAVVRTEPNGEFKICLLHMSAPEKAQEKRDFFPVNYGADATDSMSDDAWQKLYDILEEIMPGGIIGMYLQNKFPLYMVNDALLKMLGYDSYEEFKKDTHEDIINIIHPDDRQKVMDIVFKSREIGYKYEVDYRAKKRDGGYVFCHALGQIIKADNGRKALISVWIDISERMEYQHLLEQFKLNAYKDYMLNYVANVTKNEIIQGNEFFKDGNAPYSETMKNFVLNCVEENSGKKFLHAVTSHDYYENMFKTSPKFDIMLKVNGKKFADEFCLPDEIRQSLINTHNEWTYVSFWCILTKNSNGDLLIQVAMKDISDEVAEKKQLKQFAELHPLTNLFNRRTWEREVRELIKNRTSGCFAIIDLDNFKAVNDNLGHPEGDRVLKKAAQTLKGAFRETDVIGHIGGDEFCVFAKNLTADVLDKKFSAALDSMREYYTSKTGEKLKISFSVGVAISPQDGTTFEELHSRSDEALYKAKLCGGDNYKLYSDL